jgi:hypothetical protein
MKPRKIQRNHFTVDFTKMEWKHWEGGDIDWWVIENVMRNLGMDEFEEIKAHYEMWKRTGARWSNADKDGIYWDCLKKQDMKITWSRARREGRWEIWRRK